MDLLSEHVSGLVIQKIPSQKWNTVLKWTDLDQNMFTDAPLKMRKLKVPDT